MSATILNKNSVREIDRQIKRVRSVLREIRETLEDLDDLRAFAEAKERNAGKPGIPWETVAKELGIRPPPKKRSRKS